MAKQTIRAYFGLREPKHRRGHRSKTLRIVSAVALLLVIAGVITTLMYHSPSGILASNPGPTSTTTANTGVANSGSGNSGTGNSGTGNSGVTGSSSTTVPRSSSTTTTAPSNVAPSSILVQVFNGSGTSGQAGTVANELSNIGFKINGIADAATFSYSASVINYPPGQRNLGEILQHYIGGKTTLEPSSSIPPGEVWLITGTDFTGVTNS